MGTLLRMLRITGNTWSNFANTSCFFWISSFREIGDLLLEKKGLCKGESQCWDPKGESPLVILEASVAGAWWTGVGVCRSCRIIGGFRWKRDKVWKYEDQLGHSNNLNKDNDNLDQSCRTKQILDIFWRCQDLIWVVRKGWVRGDIWQELERWNSFDQNDKWGRQNEFGKEVDSTFNPWIKEKCQVKNLLIS